MFRPLRIRIKSRGCAAWGSVAITECDFHHGVQCVQFCTVFGLIYPSWDDPPLTRLWRTARMRLSRSPMTATPTNLGAMINEPRTALLDQYCELVGRGGGGQLAIQSSTGTTAFCLRRCDSRCILRSYVTHSFRRSPVPRCWPWYHRTGSIPH